MTTVNDTKDFVNDSTVNTASLGMEDFKFYLSFIDVMLSRGSVKVEEVGVVTTHREKLSNFITIWETQIALNNEKQATETSVVEGAV